MARLTQNDFRLDYMVNNRYPIIAQWVLDKQLSHNGKTYGADIMQRKERPELPMMFYPTVRISTVDEMNKYDERDDAVITSNGIHLGEFYNMNDALTAIMRFIMEDATKDANMRARSL